MEIDIQVKNYNPNKPSMSLRRVPGTIHIFTDGACHNNGKPNAVAGYGVHFPFEEYDDLAEPFTYAPITNQRAELYAIYHALTIALGDSEIEDVNIYSDSDYSIKCITQWAPKWHKAKWTRPGEPLKNLDIIKPLYRLYTYNRDRVHFTHVRSHTGGTDDLSIGNDVADQCATKGAFSLLSEEEIEELKAAAKKHRGRKKRKRARKDSKK